MRSEETRVALTDLSMMASTSSMRSRNISLLVYLTPVLLHGMLESWPVGSLELTLAEGKGRSDKQWHRSLWTNKCITLTH